MVDEVFKNLVDQFSDPFTCLRELVQNAMDAGTESIEVRARYLDDPGGAMLEIRDFGAGMTRDIIDTKLTRLFASDKENDLTKIGKFGIGFVSVFSLKPELVIVDTGRDGEYWRIAFDGGTDFALFTLHEPIEGTSVRLYKLMQPEEFTTFEERCRATLSTWCRHSATTISFNGTAINCDLVVESPVRVDTRTPLGRFNVGICGAKPYTFGLYNSGLTLMEGEQESLPGVSFKILSNHLEHTLTRDAVIKDENYAKVMGTLEGLVKDDLLAAVLKALQDPDRREVVASQTRAYLGWRTGKLSASEKKMTMFCDVFGHPVSFKQLSDCAKAEDRLFLSSSAEKLAQRATREGIPVLPFEPESAAASLCSFLFGVPVVRLEENLAVSQPVARPAGFASLEGALRALLREGRLTVTSVVPVEYPDSPRDPEALPCVFALGSDRLVRRYRKGFWATKYLLPQQLLLDVDHPLVRKALTRLESPANCRTVAYALCKSALLSDGLDPATENRLLSTLLERA
jgi:hypothetical protein